MDVIPNPMNFYWQIEILPALESWDPALAWIHNHSPIYAGLLPKGIE